jgi:hypothetical protein
MRKACKISFLVWVSLVLAVLSCSGVLAQDEVPIKIEMTLAKTTFETDEAVKVQIRAYNNPNDAIADVITRYGFFGQDFYTLITFTDPDGLPVRNTFKDETDDPGPPDVFGGRPATEVEVISSNFDPPLPEGKLLGERVIVLEDAREFYNLEKYGWYTAQVLVSMETFPLYVEDIRGVRYGFLDDPDRRGYDPLASNKVRFEILPPEPVETGAVHVKVSLLQVGQGPRPRRPLEGAKVMLIPQTEIPEEYYPINWMKYDEIWTWANSEVFDFLVICYTDGEGMARFETEQDDYLVLAYHAESPDFKNMGSPISADDPAWLTEQPIEKNLIAKE